MTNRTTSRTLTVLTAALLTLSACGGGGDDTASEPTAAPAEASATTGEQADNSATVTLSRSRFDQTELRVAAGTTVTFVNTDRFAHTITSRDDSLVAFDSGEFGQDETFEFAFDEPGEYAYFCQIHPTMRAVVIVE